VPILALVDGDPYGIDILSVYKFGSLALKHEDSKLAAGRVEWAGIWASELQSCVRHVYVLGSDGIVPSGC
jgi:meiotic recombination protein SPO11